MRVCVSKGHRLGSAAVDLVRRLSYALAGGSRIRERNHGGIDWCDVCRGSDYGPPWCCSTHGRPCSTAAPFFFPDTSHYVRAADAAVVSLTGHRSIWSDRLLDAPAAPAAKASRPDAASPPGADLAPGAATATAPQIRPARTVLTGRSIYYGAFLYAGLEGFGRFGPVIFQSAIAVGTVALFLFGATASLAPGRRQRWIWGGLIAVGLLSPLPFFVSRLMPGAFTGPLILAFVSLILFSAHYGRLARAFLLMVAAAAITFHISHILLILSVGAGALLLNVGQRHGWALRLLLPTGLILLAVAAQMLFSAAVTRTLGAPPTAPPFLSARLIADGPGYRYLETHCKTPAFLLCAYRDRMPQPSDIMLWSEDPREGIFSTLGEDAKRQLGSQDVRFYLAVLREYPGEVVGSIIRSSGEQALAFDLDHFNYVAEHREGARSHLPPEIFAWVERSAAYRGTVPVAPTITVTIAVTLLSLILIAAGFASPRGRAAWRSPGAAAALLILLALAANVVICGGMSTPHARYMMRIVWLLPLAVIAFASAIPRRRGDHANTPAPYGLSAVETSA